MTTIPMTLRGSGVGPGGIKLDTYQVDQVVQQDDKFHTWWVVKRDGVAVAAFGVVMRQAVEGKVESRWAFAATPIVNGEHALNPLEMLVCGKIIETIMTAGRNAE